MSSKLKKLLKASMIGPKEKGIEKEQVESAVQGIYAGVDLKVLPKYLCYKASLLREKMTLKSIIALVLTLFLFQYCTGRMEVMSLHKKLREKEYILAPGVQDFTTASPQAVPDSYVNDAVNDFLSDLGNVSANNIDEQYNTLKRFMSDKLKVAFDLEASSWMEQVKTEGISQISTVIAKEIKTDNDGNYHVVATTRAEFYANQQYLGHEDQVIEMTMKLSPPERGRRWYLELTSLNWGKAETFKTKNNLSK
ncbi:MAG: hypothetical protein COW79_07685 [Bdellovibrionales bacterium CG22_combo_CG10-13_8_21_14_all_38_13]|nr:MAG: hypothetical protein COW79_07685 [Bdellovibrionales bacterium CG22_combo_CG10-13_8_21_14_all_38_13]